MLPRRRRTLLATAGIVAALGVTGGPATAHPFGPPSTARLTADGSRVELTWQAAEDDWVALGQSLGAFEDPSLGTVDTALTGEQKLQRSEAVRAYLTDRISVHQSGQPCPASLLPLEELLRRGARLEFTCPAPVAEVEVRLDALTDLHTAYRTVLTADGTAEPALFTAEQPTHRIALTGRGSSPAVPVAAGTAAVVAAGLVLLLVRRYRRTRRNP